MEQNSNSVNYFACKNCRPVALSALSYGIWRVSIRLVHAIDERTGYPQTIPEPESKNSKYAKGTASECNLVSRPSCPIAGVGRWRGVIYHAAEKLSAFIKNRHKTLDHDACWQREARTPVASTATRLLICKISGPAFCCSCDSQIRNCTSASRAT